LVAEADLAQSGSSTTAKLRATIDQWALSGVAPLRITPPGGPTTVGAAPQGTVWWQEPRLALSVAAAYDRQADTLQLDSSQFDSTSFRLTGAGQLERLSTEPSTTLTGTIDYDGQTLSRLLQTYFGSQIQLVGHQTRPFSFRGRLTPPAVALNSGTGPRAPTILVSSQGAAVQVTPASQDWLKSLAAEASLGWISAGMYGMQAGPGQLNAKLADGAIQFSLDNAALSEGHLTAAPLMRLERFHFRCGGIRSVESTFGTRVQ
jgi:hypothetical protein